MTAGRAFAAQMALTNIVVPPDLNWTAYPLVNNWPIVSNRIYCLCYITVEMIL